MPIPRARGFPHLSGASPIKIRSETRTDGYVLQAHIPADAITGYDPQEHTRLGFTYAVLDREMGRQTFTVGSEFPFDSDPTLWGTLELTRD